MNMPWTVPCSLSSSLCLLSQSFSPRHFSWTRSDPHRSCCSTFSITCHVTSTAVSCSESIEYFPGVASKLSFKTFVTIPVSPVTTGMITHFMFHIRCISLYINICFVVSFCMNFLSAGIATSITTDVFSFLFLITISGLFAITSLSSHLDSTTLSHLYFHILHLFPSQCWLHIFKITSNAGARTYANLFLFVPPTLYCCYMLP